VYVIISITYSYNISHLFFCFFNDTPTTEIYTLSLHDALPIFTNDQIKEMTRKVSAEVDLVHQQTQNQRYGSSAFADELSQPQHRSEERFSRNAETDLVCRLLLEKKKQQLLMRYTEKMMYACTE